MKCKFFKRCFQCLLIFLTLWTLPAMGEEVKIALDAPRNLELSGTYIWAKTFSDELSAKGMPPQLFDRGALGDEAEKLDQVSQGLLEISCSDIGKVGQLDPAIFGFTMPFLFDSMAHIDEVVSNTDLLANINKKLAKRGVRVLALVPVGGFVGIFNTRKTIKTPADMKDLRFRAADNSQVAWLKAWGTSSVVIPWAEIYSSLQTGVADGYLNVPIVPIMFKHTEVIKYFSDIRICLPLRIILCSQDWYKGLSAKKRAIVQEAVQIADAAVRKAQLRWEKSGKPALQKAGVMVYENSPEEIALFADPIKSRYSQMMDPVIVKEFVRAADAHGPGK